MTLQTQFALLIADHEQISHGRIDIMACPAPDLSIKKINLFTKGLKGAE